MTRRLPNPLDNFTSYSTQFIMVACRTTENARKFAEANATVSMQAINSARQLGAPITFDGKLGDLFLVLDTRRFSQFSVDRMKYDVLINGLQSSASHGNLATEIEMTILDSVGISFMNYLQWLMDSQMQCGFDGMIFMIKVVFVGHKENGDSDVVDTVTIPCHLFKIDVSLDLAKGVYDCLFMPNFNFAINTHQRWLNIGQASRYFTGAGNNKLGAMVNSFENELNRLSAEYFKDISGKMLKAGNRPASTRPGEYGRLVRYMITLPQGWAEFDYTGPSIHDAIEKEFVKVAKDKQTSEQKAATGSGESATPATSTYMSVDPGQTITQVLDLMFKQVNAIQQLANSERLDTKDKPVTFFKYLTSVTSDDSSFTVHVDVIAFEIPNVSPPVEKTTQPKSGLVDDEFSKVVTEGGITFKQPRNFFELDYIFTGKNLDILNFDLKIQDLQFLLQSSVKVGEGEMFNVSQKVATTGNSSEESAGEKQEVPTSSRQYDPILMPLLTPEQKSNFSSYVTARTPEESKRMHQDMQAYSRNLSAFYAQSPIMINLTIKGNPDIMQKFNIDRPTQHANPSSAGQTGTSRSNGDVKDEYRKNLENDILKSKAASVLRGANGTFIANAPLGDRSYASTPVFAKINIKGPNVDITSNELIGGQDFATEVFYNNYYVVMQVSNLIERGVFTQELQLWSHNVYGQGKLTKDEKTGKVALKV